MTDRTGHDSLIGQRLGRYRISASLGRGGMAEVFQASDDELGREVAIKVVLPAYATDDQFLQRFQREARAVASLEHPNILPIYDIGEHRGLPFLVMQLVRGGTLAERIGGRPLDPARAAAWIAELAGALDAAHGAGVLHRDVKPGNVLIGGEERALLADFGIARLCDATRLTRTGTVVGTPVYMAPEVAAGRPAAAAADGYSLAVMAYEMLAGAPPFDGENPLSILHQHATRPVPPITTRVGHLPSGVDSLLEWGLAKDPALRPASCRGFADRLVEQVAAEGVAGPPPPAVGAPTLRAAGLATPVSTTAATVPAATAAVAPPSGDAYATVHPASGGLGHFRQWAAAGLLGGAVALAAFLALQSMDREREDGAASGAAVPAAAAGAEVPPDPPPATGGEAVAGVPAAPPPPPVAAVADEVPPASTPLDAPGEPQMTADIAASPPPLSEPRGSAPSPVTDRPERPSDRGPLAAARRLYSLRSFTSRSTQDDFLHAREAARRLADRGPKAAQARTLERYAEGGLAYLRGDDAAAGTALREALGSRPFVAFWGPSPMLLLASANADRQRLAAWELALGFGDARGVAGTELDALLRAEPTNARYRVARALVHRLDGEHEAVIRYAAPIVEQLAEEDAPEAESYLALVVADAYLGLDRGGEALEWYRRAIAAGGPFHGIVALRAAEAAHGLRREDTAREFLQTACDAEVRQACERLAASTRRRGSRR